jgi:hypothetical protein
MKFSFDVPEFTSVNWPRIFNSGVAPETNCISRDSLLIAYPGASGTVQAALQIRVAMAASGARREWNAARDKMSDSNGQMAFGEVRNAIRTIG